MMGYRLGGSYHNLSDNQKPCFMDQSIFKDPFIVDKELLND
jgi:hypothetical protein